MADEDKVRSPCVSICALDEHDVCIGCQRTSDEILRWTSMSSCERKAVLVKVAEREQKIAL
ncbi:DUF1289 domain-containing protein [Marinobacter sp. 1_MG-2023]|uniref:DUF1289 domain-containing protein n=1 Tax=Marinobacter sp. 1_MG-2023 TaxID=3062627 RepID=UPI0026E1FBF6|nr:DUF1289 domain-containing protein [Marinobacter sp. 1_MG-2023]MDO6825428.1 DUF1289 domain-containing protein [Marinobacter sp. 1_MG-2023]